jgi:neurofibromin 1
LNLAFLNLCSSEPWLRVAAYKLLCAVKDAFKLQIDYKLDASHDICIPQNCSQFVLDVSQQLAVKEPHLTLEVNNNNNNQQSTTLIILTVPV